MPVETLIATQVVDYFSNPIFDMDTWWNIPLWVWICVGIIFLCIGNWLRWVLRKSVMKPVSDYLIALKGGKREDQQCWIFGKNRSFFIEYLKFSDEGVISYQDLIKSSMWYLGASTSVGHAGGIKSLMLSGDFDMPRDPASELAIIAAVDSHNKKVPEKDQIIDFDGYVDNRHTLEKENPHGVDIDVYSLYNPTSIQRLFPLNRSAEQFGEIMIRDARELNSDLPGQQWYEKYVLLGIILVAGIFGGILLYLFMG